MLTSNRYLATGASSTDLHYNWKISTAALSSIVTDACTAVYDVLGGSYITTPSITDESLNISRELERRWNFPNVLGAIDGEHVIMNKPWHAGSEYYNYKGLKSINLMAMCDAEYR